MNKKESVTVEEAFELLVVLFKDLQKENGKLKDKLKILQMEMLAAEGK